MGLTLGSTTQGPKTLQFPREQDSRAFCPSEFPHGQSQEVLIPSRFCPKAAKDKNEFVKTSVKVLSPQYSVQNISQQRKLTTLEKGREKRQGH